MHPVRKLIDTRLRGKSDGPSSRLFVVLQSGGARWVLVGGMAARLELLNRDAPIPLFDGIVGTSSGGLSGLYLARKVRQSCLVVQHLTDLGLARDGGRKFIAPLRSLRGEPIMDVHALIHRVFTHDVPMGWEGFATLDTPTYLTATRWDGTPVLQRMNGLSAEEAKLAAVNTARIPWVGHSLSDRSVLWDGHLTAGLPISEAITLGATHVLVLRSNSQTFGVGHNSRTERWLIRPRVWLQNPTFAKLLAEAPERTLDVIETYRHHPNVLWCAASKATISSSETREAVLVDHLLQGWHALEAALGLPQAPYPIEWAPMLSRHGYGL